MAESPKSRIGWILDRWRPLAVALTGIVIANVALDALVIRRSVQVSGDRDALIAASRRRVADVRRQAEELERITSKLACTRSDIGHVFDDLLSSKEGRMTAIQKELRAMAAERGMDPERIAYSAAPIKDTGLVRFEIQFPLQGSYATLEQFIVAVESSPNFLIVQDITMNEGGQGGRLDLQVKLATYFQAPSDEPPEAAALPAEEPT